MKIPLTQTGLTGSEQGYASAPYAQALAEFGTLRELPRCRGWLLENQIPSTNFRDATGCYPMFFCQHWELLKEELKTLDNNIVSIRLVTNPFAEVTGPSLVETFPHVCFQYKQHFVTDLSRPLDGIVRGNHRRNVRSALDALELRESTGDADLLSIWQSLYANLITRHSISGIARFSPQSFALQAQVPGFTAFSAIENGKTLGMTLWYLQHGVAYYHLGAYSDAGYVRGASFGLFWHALSHFARLGARWASLGAGAGTTDNESGLTRFKRGWATETRPVYFCGRILKPAIYAELTSKSSPRGDFFPAYRAA